MIRPVPDPESRETDGVAIESGDVERPRGARSPRGVFTRPRHDRPRIAIFSPWPPKATGVSTHAARLANALWPRYAIDVYHEPGYLPEPALRSGAFGAFVSRDFPRRERALGYRAVLHQMGNSFYHGFIHDLLREIPGVVTLHDPCLADFHFWRAHRLGGDPFENLRRLLYEQYPGRFAELDPQIRGFTEEHGGFSAALARRGLFVNRDVVDAARALVVHSGWSLKSGRLDGGTTTATVIPLGASPRRVTTERRSEARSRYGLAPGDFAVGCFGLLSVEKLNAETIRAFDRAFARDPSAVLIFAGGEGDGGLARAVARDSGLGDRVRFLGMRADPDYLRALEAVDLGVCLRRPPTRGETSAALLDLLRHGIPTVINDAGAFDDFPATAVAKFTWDDRDGVERLAEILRDLADRPEERLALGTSAFEHVRTHHAWPIVASRYAEVFEGTGPASRLAS